MIATTNHQSAPPQFGRTVHRQLAMYEALRRLGFAPDEIYVCWECSSPRTVVQRDGKTFAISYPDSHEHPPDESDWILEWLRESNRWNNNMDDVERSGIYGAHITSAVLNLLAVALESRGFRVRPIEN